MGISNKWTNQNHQWSKHELLEIFQSFEMSNNSSIINDDFIKKIKNIFSQIKETKSMDKYQTRLPFEIIID